jgi:hypothetical protein
MPPSKLLQEIHGQQILGGRACIPAFVALLFRHANGIVVIWLLGGMAMFTTKLNIMVAVFGVMIALIEPAFAGTPVPAPIIGAGLPALAILGGGYWLVKKLRERR